MKFLDLFGYLSGYSSRKIVLSIAALAISLILKKIFGKSKYKKLAAVMPFAAGILLYLARAFIVSPEENFGEIVKEGTSAGSAATVIYAIIMSFLKDPSDYEEVPFDSLIIEGLLAGYVTDADLKTAAEKLADILRENLPPDDEREKLVAVLRELCPDITEAEAEFIVKIILNVLTATN